VRHPWRYNVSDEGFKALTGISLLLSLALLILLALNPAGFTVFGRVFAALVAAGDLAMLLCLGRRPVPVDNGAGVLATPGPGGTTQ
jgi:hypothetical protein